jgi:hypothetical protein
VLIILSDTSFDIIVRAVEYADGLKVRVPVFRYKKGTSLACVHAALVLNASVLQYWDVHQHVALCMHVTICCGDLWAMFTSKKTTHQNTNLTCAQEQLLYCPAGY